MTNEQNQAIDWKDRFLREIRVYYISSDKRYPKVSAPEDIADLVRSVLIDNSRKAKKRTQLDSRRVSAFVACLRA